MNLGYLTLALAWRKGSLKSDPKTDERQIERGLKVVRVSLSWVRASLREADQACRLFPMR